MGTYRTADDRFISLILLQSDKHWADFVERLGVPEHGHRPAVRRLGGPGRERRRRASPGSTRPSAASRCRTGRRRSTTFEGVWSPFQTLDELYDDVQVQANGYLPDHDGRQRRRRRSWSPAPPSSTSSRSRSSAPPSTASTPSWSSWTLGYDWDQIAALKESGAIL